MKYLDDPEEFINRVFVTGKLIDLFSLKCFENLSRIYPGLN